VAPWKKAAKMSTFMITVLWFGRIPSKNGTVRHQRDPTRSRGAGRSRGRHHQVPHLADQSEARVAYSEGLGFRSEA